MGFFSRKRYVVTTVTIAVDPADVPSVHQLLSGASTRVRGGEHHHASEAVADVSGFLLSRPSAWTHVSNHGAVFKDEGAAARYGDEVFADCAARYLSSNAAGADEVGLEVSAAEGRASNHVVVMLTVAYQGANAALEKTLATRTDVDQALSGIVALHHRDALEIAALHYAPAHANDLLTDDRLLVNFPELLAV